MAEGTDRFEELLRRELLKRTDASRALITLAGSEQWGNDGENVDDQEISTRLKGEYVNDVTLATVMAAIAGDEQARRRIDESKLLGIFDYQSMHFFELTPDYRLVPSDFSDFAYRLQLVKNALETTTDKFWSVLVVYETNVKIVQTGI